MRRNSTEFLLQMIHIPISNLNEALSFKDVNTGSLVFLNFLGFSRFYVVLTSFTHFLPISHGKNWLKALETYTQPILHRILWEVKCNTWKCYVFVIFIFLNLAVFNIVELTVPKTIQ